jgi:xylulokinase
MNGGGKVVASGSEEHEPFVTLRSGWAEQRPQDWWRVCGSAVRKALNSSELRGDEITCVGFSGQMHGAVLPDSSDEVVRSAIIWCDQRSEAQSNELSELFGRDALIQLTCNPPLSNFTLTKLLWVRETEPGNWARVAHIMLPKDYVRFRLTGERAIDVADASGTLLLDVANRQWSAQVLSMTGIEKKLLPVLYESRQVCGKVSAAGAKATGLKEGTPVVAGAGDQAAGAVGMGIARAGAVSATIGTSVVVFAATDRPALDPRGRLHTFCHAIPGRWHEMGVTQAAGLSLRWFRDRFGGVSDSKKTRGAILTTVSPTKPVRRPPGSEGAFWLPYLMGERTPHLDPNARAALVGLSASHTRGHVTQTPSLAPRTPPSRLKPDRERFSKKLSYCYVNESRGQVSRLRSSNPRRNRRRRMEFRRRSLRLRGPSCVPHCSRSSGRRNDAALLSCVPQAVSRAARRVELLS